MKKIRGRAISVLLITALVIVGMTVYVLRYIDNGADWALFFSRANSGSTGELTDRDGVMLASFSSTESLFNEDRLTRMANYHVTGDYWGRTGTGVLTSFFAELQGFSPVMGTTRSEHRVLRLNIDARLNNAAYTALGEDRDGAFLLCNYKTGELLCMVSGPSVDPMEPEAELRDGAYINRCLSAAFTPGSVFKLITAAAAIENIPDIYSRSFYCERIYEIAGVEITCSGTHYEQTFEQAMANSCNCAFAQIAVLLGQDTLRGYAKAYGFLDGHSLDGISTAAGRYPEEFVGDPETAWSGIGQSTDMICPYSMLRMVSAIANGGTLAEPRLVASDSPPEMTKLIEPDTADKLRQLMSYNVAYHYDGDVNFPGLRLCAKTGTAELGDGTSHSWFAGFLDDEEHPYAFVSLVERGGGGLSVAGAMANTILQEAVKEHEA